MRLRSRVLLCFAVTTASLIAGQYWILSRSMLKAFSELERRSVTRDVERTTLGFDQLIKDLHVKTVDWSNWDDSYKFMTDHNQAYIKSNLVESAIAPMQLDLILFLNPHRRIFEAVPAKRFKDVDAPDPRAIVKALEASASLRMAFQREDGFSGVIDASTLPLLISVRPILTTSGKGPFRGWLLFGRYVNTDLWAQLAARTRLNLSSYDLNHSMPDDCRRVLPLLFHTKNMAIRPLDESHVAAYALLKDVNDRPITLIKVLEARSVYREGRRSAAYLTRLTAAASLIFSLMTLLVLELSVLARIASLSRQVANVTAPPVPEARVELAGNDELAHLASSVNKMLLALSEEGRRLRESEEQLRIYNANLERTVAERTHQIQHSAFHDSLTDLPNRALFIDRLAIVQSRSQRSRCGIAVLFIDLDNFKVINDSQGHETGDLLLLTVAERLQGSLRAGDTVARLGGDEFTVLLDDLKSEDEAYKVVEKIMETLRLPVCLPHGEFTIGASIGLVYSLGGEEAPDVLLRNADTAMYQAKTDGKGACAVFCQSMNDRVVERLEIETGLRHALERGELRVFYQPLLDLPTRRLSAMEALVRWEHPVRGLIPPGKFIPIAEEVGLIAPIGYWVLEQACLHTKIWHDSHPGDSRLTINVNLSGRQLQQADVVERVLEVLEKTGLPADALTLEITESVLMANVEDVVAKLTELKRIGVKLAIDDFGTGYSSMSSLKSFPVDTVKIDRSFVSRMEEQEGMAIVKAILTLSRALGMNVTGEGIETAQQALLLQELGCDKGQGFYFARPMPGESLEASLRELDTSGRSSEKHRKAA